MAFEDIEFVGLKMSDLMNPKVDFEAATVSFAPDTGLSTSQQAIIKKAKRRIAEAFRQSSADI